MKKSLIALIIIIGVYGYIQKRSNAFSSISKDRTQSEQAITEAFQRKLSDIQVAGSGQVVQILGDDNKGSRHQRFLLRLSSGQNLLIAHNIDLAPRINTLKKGDSIEFYGEYEWNSKGGVIHWTHHDPSGRHVGGWLKHKERKYE